MAFVCDKVNIYQQELKKLYIEPITRPPNNQQMSDAVATAKRKKQPH